MAHGTWHIINQSSQEKEVCQFFFIHAGSACSIMWPVCMWSPCLIQYVMVYQAHPCTHWWIERAVNPYMDSWSPWYITHQPMQETEVCKFSPMHSSPSLECCVSSMDVVPLLGCFYKGVSTSHMPSLMTGGGCYTCMGYWSSWHITHQPRQEQEVCQFSSIYDGPSLEYCVASMYVVPLLGCLYNGVSTPTMTPLMHWEVCQYIYG